MTARKLQTRKPAVRPNLRQTSSKQTITSQMICIVGPTASGKSELAVQLAKKYAGEIISCDSRQVYRELNIGTGKVKGKWLPGNFLGRKNDQFFIYKDIVHHCIDFVNPRRQYSAAQFQKAANKAIREIQKRGHIPILCGGTGHWIDAVAFNQQLPNVKPDFKLRKQLEQQSCGELFARIQELDPQRAASIDRNNKRRLIRALEIILVTGKPVPERSFQFSVFNFHMRWVGLYPGQAELYKKIDQRLRQRLRQGLIQEVRNLHDKQKLSWKRLESFGLEYKFIALYLQKKLSKQEMIVQLSFAIKHYAKRQVTWFKRNKKIDWVNSSKQALLQFKKFFEKW